MTDDRLYLIHILECIERIELYTSKDKGSFFVDTRTQDAVTRNLQTLTESTQRVSNSLKAEHPEINWSSLSAFRNVLVHNYLGVDLTQIRDIVEPDLPVFKSQIQIILQNLPGTT